MHVAARDGGIASLPYIHSLKDAAHRESDRPDQVAAETVIMRPYILKGHERPLTQLKFNREGDLIFSCAKDKNPTLWFSENGERVGTYNGHNGAVPTCDVTIDSQRLLTASQDSSAKLWDVQSGECLFTWNYGQPCRAVAYSVGDELAVITVDPFQDKEPEINIVRMAEDVSLQSKESLDVFKGYKGRIVRIAFSDLNRYLITAQEDGTISRWDVEKGEKVDHRQIHKSQITDMQFSKDGSHFITASKDFSAQLLDTRSFEVLKTYQTERPCNSAAISPIYEHVLLGGGQDAGDVTTTSAKAGGFEARFFHKIYMEEFGMVKGHFGPINSVAFHPDGNGFVTGSEDGFIRLHAFDNDYHATRFF